MRRALIRTVNGIYSSACSFDHASRILVVAECHELGMMKATYERRATNYREYRV